MTHSHSLSPEALSLLKQIQEAAGRAPRTARPFRFYDLRPVSLRYPDLANSSITHTTGYSDRNLTTHFNAQGLADVSVPTAALLSNIEGFSIPQSDERERVDAYRNASDDLSNFGDDINDRPIYGLILHDGLPDGSLEVWPEEFLELRETGLLEMQSVANFRLTMEGRRFPAQPSTLENQSLPKVEPSPQPEQPRILLSHSTKDNEFVQRLHDDLENAGLDVWVDWLELKVGDSIVNKINEQFESTDYLVVVLSPAAMESNWVKAELGAGMMQELSDQSLTVLPVLHQKVELPALLQDRVYADFSLNYFEGLKQLLSFFKKDLSTVKDVVLDLPSQQKPQETACIDKLNSLREKDLRQKVAHRTNHAELRELWRDTLGGDMNDEIPNRSVGESVLELFIRADKADKIGELLNNLCDSFPELAGSPSTNRP